MSDDEDDCHMDDSGVESAALSSGSTSSSPQPEQRRPVSIRPIVPRGSVQAAASASTASGQKQTQIQTPYFIKRRPIVNVQGKSMCVRDQHTLMMLQFFGLSNVRLDAPEQGAEPDMSAVDTIGTYPLLETISSTDKIGVFKQSGEYKKGSLTTDREFTTRYGLSTDDCRMDTGIDDGVGPTNQRQDFSRARNERTHGTGSDTTPISAWRTKRQRRFPQDTGSSVVMCQYCGRKPATRYMYECKHKVYCEQCYTDIDENDYRCDCGQTTKYDMPQAED